MPINASAHTEALQQDIVRDAVRESPIGPLLQKAKVLAVLLRDSSFKEWVDAEIQGYVGRDLPLPSYRMLGCGIHAQFASLVMRGSKVFDPSLIEDALRWERGKISRLPVNISASAIESYKMGGNSLDFAIPGLHLESLVQKILAPGVTCLSAHFTIASTELESVLSTVRSLVLDYALAATQDTAGVAQAAVAHRESVTTPGSSSSSSSVNIQFEAMTKKTTNFSPSNSNVSNVNIDSYVDASPMLASVQSVVKGAQPQGPLSSEDELLFRQEIKDILHLLVDRYEDLDTKLQGALQDALTQAQRLAVQGKTVKEVEDMVGDLWAKTQADAMRHQLPKDILEVLKSKSWLSFFSKLFGAAEAGPEA